MLALMDTERGDWDGVTGRLRTAREMIEAAGASEYWMTAAVELVGGLAAERAGDLPAAEGLLARSLMLCRRGQGPVETANALLHLARIHRSQGLQEVADDEVEEAAMLVESAPDPGSRVMRLLAVARGQARPPGPSRPRGTGADELSHRELGVLRLLASELTQREIGHELYLSLNTVKSHTRSIFRKLGVSSREQAVARARDQELI
jgi:LuxR family maltose regulon positive regulatory protein